MPIRSSVPETPRYRLAEKAARRFLCMLAPESFPIDPLDIIERLPTVTCWAYTDASSLLGLADPLHLRQQHADARTLYIREGEYYIIVYEDTLVRSHERVRFTLAHEIGHILLGHFTDFDSTCLSRNGGLNEKAYRVLEQEADCFAGELLAPTAFFRHTDITRDQLRLLCGLSDAAANTRMLMIAAERQENDDTVESELYHALYPAWSQKEKSIYQRLLTLPPLIQKKYAGIIRICGSCGAYIQLPDALYCPYCGKRYQKNDATSGHLPLTVTANAVCPACRNEELGENDRYCRICGQPVRNRCLAENKPLPAYCRYCPDCGSVTAMNASLREAERRQDFMTRVPPKEDMIPYPDSAYLLDTALRKGYLTLYAALLLSRIYLTDDNNIRVITPTEPEKKDIIRHSGILLSIADQFEKKHPMLEVACIHEI